ncbi:hypothetical protein BN6_60480 [Saccharothrix espanaensis DSM 44229]|uniref:Uncharacterized protein n=1 Tax=Saccharothrix espanaensis (strain ATCC 51144 / DSM 44229 / JCM 9112 / NBRC 15066 / NRRL 15764) TaxID=1179773 RepID=K0K6Y7_SACES|nr:hypothetical protein BN6_60480 [Saccharothrix espanaensis DSM 44229]
MAVTVGSGVGRSRPPGTKGTIADRSLAYTVVIEFGHPTTYWTFGSGRPASAGWW